MPATRFLNDPIDAAKVLADGGTVAIPTETVYGLAARFDRPEAVGNIFKAKGRPSDNPLIVHLASLAWLPRITPAAPENAIQLLTHFAPGPLTVTVPRGPVVSDQITAGLASVAVRIPAHPLARAVLDALDVPLVAPSANRSGRPSPTTWQAVRDELDGRIDAILMGPPTTVGIESTVVDCCSQPPRLLRPGGISYEQLLDLIPDLQIYVADPSNLQNAASPGLRHRHYSPRCKIILVDQVETIEPQLATALLSLEAHPRAQDFAWTEIFPTTEAYAAGLFSAFRRADQDNLNALYCEQVPTSGIGRGIMDRLRRAAESS